MSNETDDQLPDDAFDAPSGGVEDLSVFDDDPPLGGIHVGSDQDAIKQIRKRTSTFGRVVAVLFVLLLGGTTWMMYRSYFASETRMEAVEACGQIEERAQMLSCLRTEFANTSYPDVKDRIIRNLTHFEDPEAIPLLITALDEAGEVRRAAAMALATFGLPAAEPAKQKLLDVLGDTDDKDWAAVVWALAVLQESAASDDIIRAFEQGRLQEMEGFTPRIITDVLGPERLSSEALLNHESEGVRMLTAQALSEVGTSAVLEPLSQLLRFEIARSDETQSSEVMREVAAGLGRTGDPGAGEPLFALMQERPTMRSGVIDALRKSVGAPAIATLIGQAADETVKRDLVRLLAETHDPRAADKLAELLVSEDEEIKSTCAVALADLGDERAVTTLVELAGGEAEGIADDALQALQRLGSPASAEGLLALLPDSCPEEPGPDMPAGCFRQAGLLRALGSTGEQSVGRRLEAALSGVDSPAAANALAILDYDPAYARLLELTERPADVDMAASNAADRSLTNEDLLRQRRGAIQAMGRYGRPDAGEALMTIVEDTSDDYELRGSAAASLGKCASAEMMQQVIAKVQDESVDEAARRYYVQALWQRPRAELNSSLLDLIASDAPTEIRRAASLAVGYAANPESDARLLQFLDDDATRREAAFAIVLGGNEESANKLMEVLAEDADVEEVLQYGVMNEENDWFNQLTSDMFEGGEVWRRARVGRILADGTANRRWGYPWLKVTTVLKAGWNGVDGVDARTARDNIYEGLTGDDEGIRALAARLLADMGERGLLIRARDEGGTGSEEARTELDRLNRPVVD